MEQCRPVRDGPVSGELPPTTPAPASNPPAASDLPAAAPLDDILTRTLYNDLRRYAAAMLQKEPTERTLQATALVHEAFARLKATGGEVPGDRGRFFALAAQILRHVLIDRARERVAIKRGGGGEGGSPPSRADPSVLDGVAAPSPGPDDATLLAIDEALGRLERIESRKARVVMLRFFGGLDVDEAAEALGVSPRTVDSDWRWARAWLARELEGVRS